MLLTFLLVLPFPRNVRKGILLFTSRALAFPVLGGMKFVHLALILAGVPLIDSSFRTYKMAQDANDTELTPNQRISVLAKKWREERNFWIAAMAFTLWCLVTVFYGQVARALRIHDELDQVRQELDELKGIKREPANKAKGLGSRFGFGQRGTSSNKKDDGGEDVDVAARADVGNASNTPETEPSAMPGVTTRRRPAAARA
jgi:hypothetical protein